MGSALHNQPHRACPMCGCFHFDVVYHYQEDYLFFDKLPKEFDIVSCKDCGFVYSDIAASQDIYDEYYSRLSVYDNLGVTYGTVTGSASIEVYAQRAKEIASFASKTDSILEIGAANGFLLEELRKLGFQNLSALDLSEKALNGLAERGFNTYSGGIFSNGGSGGVHKPLKEQFDCVCLTQVMEHIYDVQGAMQAMKRMIKPGGYMYIEVPDAGKFNEFRTLPVCFFNYEHIQYFDETSLRNLAAENGLYVRDVIHKTIRFDTAQGIYPCVVGVFQKSNLAMNNYSLDLRAYGLTFRKVLDRYVDSIQNTEDEFALWGMGTFARQLLKRVNGIWNIKYLIDSNPLHEGKRLLGHSIDVPEKLVKENFSGTILITTSLYSDEVVSQIKKMGVACKYIKM